MPERKNTSYYKSKVKKTPQKTNGYTYIDKAKNRQMNSYIKAVIIVLLFMIIFTCFILLGLFLNNLISGGTEEISGEPATDTSLPEEFIPPTEPQTETPDIDMSLIYDTYKGAYLDLTGFTDIGEFQFKIDELKNAGINAITIDIKREDGIIPYNSSVELAYTVGSVEYNGELLIEDIIEYCRDNDIYVSGMLTCFKDTMAATMFPNYALLDVSSGMKWSDTYGDYWLNAYSENAREYVTSLAVEAVSLGFNEIILNYFFLPNTNNTTEIDYKDNGISRYDTVRDFAMSVRQKIKEQSPDAKLGLHIPIRYFLNTPHSVIGVNPDELISVCEFFTTSFAPSDILPSLIVNGSYLPKNAVSDPYNTLLSLCAHFKAYLPLITFRPMIQGFDSEDGIVYDEEKISAQIQALHDNDIKIYTIIY